MAMTITHIELEISHHLAGRGEIMHGVGKQNRVAPMTDEATYHAMKKASIEPCSV